MSPEQPTIDQGQLEKILKLAEQAKSHAVKGNIVKSVIYLEQLPKSYRSIVDNAIENTLRKGRCDNEDVLVYVDRISNAIQKRDFLVAECIALMLPDAYQAIAKQYVAEGKEEHKNTVTQLKGSSS